MNAGSELVLTVTCWLASDRMFTSRSEYRVSIRADNADLRLTAKAHAVGAVSPDRWRAFSDTKTQMEQATRALKEYTLTPQGWARLGMDINKDGVHRR